MIRILWLRCGVIVLRNVGAGRFQAPGLAVRALQKLAEARRGPTQ